MQGAVQLHILHHAAEGGVHGLGMIEELAKHGHRISPGTMYPSLHRMEQEGLLTSHEWLVGGRYRRVYTATEHGREVLQQTRLALRELTEEVLGE